MSVWAGIFMAIGEFQAFSATFFHSAVKYTILGYGDFVMHPDWRLLGPFEAATGVLMFGLSVSLYFALIGRIYARRAK